VVAECVNRNAADFRIFTTQVILRDKRLDLIAHCLIERHLACDCSTARSFGTATSFQQRTAIMTLNATHLGRTLTLRKRPVQSALESFYSGCLFSRDLSSRTSKFTR
jgi:hypothetical protein